MIFFNLVLTEKGLEVMKAIPGAIDSQSQPLGKQISAALKSGTKETLKLLTNQALAIGIKIAAQNLDFKTGSIAGIHWMPAVMPIPSCGERSLSTRVGLCPYI
ncbi:hypothetical protein IM311_19455 [Enterobacter cloacae complex sp. P40RS]|uniref:Uncharacterized protein n=1 Tax=Enterobacter pasteurii TaxID=3029761 RepID=A0ABR9QCF7_9ENTR|nr:MULTISPECIES: hypothetical protein [Enterobacter cloacae complex]MBE4856244.1 hypothetical protein [Enterobacter pasteurii]MBE4863832.1 hypothetical protein [Enterobacter cloacae complex sp. P40C2]MBE4875946.1 hypothetical protein [Enterobacter cloacae complex sp. P40C]